MSTTEVPITSENVDISNCDREQIQYAGAIQPHGVMLVLEEPGLRILQVSRNTEELLGFAPDGLTGADLRKLFSRAQFDALQGRLLRGNLEGAPKHMGRAEFRGREFDMLAHRCDGALIIELELRPEAESAPVLDLYSDLRGAISRLEATTGLQPFFDLAVEQIRALSGFDRVMIYKFMEDGSGWVRAEALSEGLEPYLGLHYPASDIPAPARRLFSLTWVRHQPDIHYTPVPLTPQLNPTSGAPLDMSFAYLRSVSIMYIDYLKNMGVQSSMVMTLLKNQELWGLIACHHQSGPKQIPYENRVACEFLTHTVSLLLSAREDMENQEYRDYLAAGRPLIMEEISRHFGSTAPASSPASKETASNLLRFVKAEGAAITRSETISSTGSTPSEKEIRQIAGWLPTAMRDDIFETDCLSAHFPEAEAFKDRCAGLLALRFSKASNGFVMWFRPEIIQSVNWAGDPNKAVNVSAEGWLSPRASFALWKEIVHLKSAPWTDVEKEAAADLRAALLEFFLKLTEEGTRRMYADLERSNAELDSFAYIASHDLKEPLRGIHNYAEMLREDYADQLDEEGKSRLATVSRLSHRMDELIDSLLEYSRVGAAEFSSTSVDLNKALNDALEFMQTRIKEDAVTVRVSGTLPVVRGDYIRLVEVFANLISNGIKYNDKLNKEIEIGLEQSVSAGPPVIYIHDNGIGIQEKHYDQIFEIFRRLHGRSEFGGGSGAGLTIIKKIIERHGGRIWLKSEVGAGTTFYFTVGQDA